MGARNWLSRLLSAVGLGGEPEYVELTFESLNETDRIVVTTNLNRPLKRIEEAETIGKVLEFVKGHRDGWHVPAEGVPVAKVRLNFYHGDRPLGNLGVGRAFLAAHQHGSFFSKKSAETDRSRLLEIIGMQDISDPLAHN